MHTSARGDKGCTRARQGIFWFTAQHRHPVAFVLAYLGLELSQNMAGGFTEVKRRIMSTLRCLRGTSGPTAFRCPLLALIQSGVCDAVHIILQV
jgi:hypothetical protein